MSVSESESKISWIFLATAVLGVGWGIWLKLNQPEEEEPEIQWVRVDGKLVELESKKPYQGVRKIDFEETPGVVQWEYTYVDGVRQGPAVEYHLGSNGAVKSRSTYVDGVVQGKVLTFHRNGVIQSEGTAVDGLLDGLVTFYNSNGTVSERHVYNRSAPAGVAAVNEVPALVEEEVEEVDPNEEVVDEVDPPLMLDPDGNPYTGTHVGTFYGGAKAFEHGYKDGRPHGMHQGWDPEGNPEYERPYFEGKENGTWKHWAKGGDLVSESEFQHGLQTGSAKTWFVGEQRRQQSQFVHGSEHGVRTNHDRGGRLRRETTFDHGIQIHQKEWSPKGDVTKDEATPAPPGLELVIEPGDQPETKRIEITDLPEDLDGGTIIGFRYRLSTEDPQPPAGVARSFKASAVLDEQVIGQYEFSGELGGWNVHEWIVDLSGGGAVAIVIDATAGPLKIDLAGIGYREDEEEEE